MTGGSRAFLIARASVSAIATTGAETFRFFAEQDSARQPEIAPGNFWLRPNLGGDSAPHTLGRIAPRLATCLDAQTGDAQLACPCPLRGQRAFGALVRCAHSMALPWE